MDLSLTPHWRFNPLSGEWVQVSPQRTQRPWLGQVETPSSTQRPAYDPECYLCPGNQRAGGARNPRYEHTFVFTNDFAALLPQAPLAEEQPHPLLRAQGVPGTCRVVCFTPRHDLSLAEMDVSDIGYVIDTWIEQAQELGQRYRWVQIFENKGEMMGCSNPHPHGQIWALEAFPNEPAKEERHQAAYYAGHQRPLLLDYVEIETALKERIVIENEHWLVLIPYWAIWPFETLLLPRQHVPRLTELNFEQCQALADILKRLLVRYDNLFETSFPYSMGWHGAPFKESQVSHWQLHAHFYPPLLRSATIKKFMVGYEMLGEPQRDITPEQAAGRLREMPEVHYKVWRG